MRQKRVSQFYVPLSDYSGMTAEQLIRFYKITQYDPSDIDKLNHHIKEINAIMDKYRREPDEPEKNLSELFKEKRKEMYR